MENQKKVNKNRPKQMILQGGVEYPQLRKRLDQ